MDGAGVTGNLGWRRYYSFSAGNAGIETTTTINTITSQYGIGGGDEISLGSVMGVTEASHDGISLCYSTKPGEAK